MSITGQPSRRCTGGRLLQLLVDLRELRVAAVVRAEIAHARADVASRFGVDREADDLPGIELEQLLRRRDPLHDRDVRHLVAEIAEGR
jgi:hypothetical protein